MKTKQILTCLALLIVSGFAHAQHRIVLNNNAYIVIDNGGQVIVENPNPNAIVEMGTGGNVVTEAQGDIIRWSIGTQTGVYTIPYTDAFGTKIPFSMNITTAGVGAGYFNFATFGTTNANVPFPSLVSNLPFPLETADRFWRLDGSSYTTKPGATISFGYQDISEIGGSNTIVEASLLAQRYNVGTSLWEGTFGTNSSATNKITGIATASIDMHTYWSLIAPTADTDGDGVVDFEDPDPNNPCVPVATATPSPTNTGAYCVGATIALSTTAVSGATYAWSGPLGFLSTLQNPTIPSATTAMSGTYSLIVTANNCASAAGTTSVVVNSIPAAPTPTSNSPICAGSTLNLSTALVSGATYAWTGPVAFTDASQTPSIPSVTTANAGTYSLTVTVNGCTSPTGSTIVVIDTPPTANAGSPIANCNGAVVGLSGTRGGSATSSTWTTAGTGSFSNAGSLTSNYTPSAADISAGSVVLTLTTNASGSCPAATSTVTITITSSPAPDFTYGSASYCQNGTNPSPVFGSGAAAGTFTAVPAGLSLNSSTGTITLSTSTVNTYTVTNTIAAIDACPMRTSNATVSIIATPATPTPTSNSAICSGSTLNLSTALVSGATYSWTGPIFTSGLQNPSISNATSTNAGTYNLTVTVDGCPSATGSTVVVVDAPATVNAGANIASCNGAAVTLAGMIGGTASNSVWTTAGSGTFSNASSLTSTYTPSAGDITAGTVVLTLTTDNPPGACNAVSSMLTVTISSAPSATFTYALPSYCQNGTNPMPAYGSGASGGTFSASPAGLTINPSTGLITLSTSAPGTYTVDNTIAANGSCPSSMASTSITVVATPAVPVASSNSPICAGSTLNLTTATVSGATYGWNGPSFTDASQNPSIPNTTFANGGTYNVSVTVNGCTSVSGNIDVSINAPATVSAGTSSGSCNGSPVALTGNIGGTATSATWTTAGSGTFSNATSVTSNYTPSGADISAGSVVVTLTTNDPAGACNAVSSNLTINISTSPTPNFSYAQASYCQNATNPLAMLDPGAAAGTFSATPAGLTLNASTGEITLSSSTVGTIFTVTNTLPASGSCPVSTFNTTVSTGAAPATPVANSNSPVCVTHALNFTTATVIGAAYTWSGPSFSNNTQNPTIPSAVQANAGTYTVTVTLNGCTSNPGSVNVVVNLGCDDDGDGVFNEFDPAPTDPCNPTPAPIAVATNTGTYCTGETIQLNTSTVAATYAWTGPVSFISSLQNPTAGIATATTAGTYTLVVTQNNCSSSPATTVVVFDNDCDDDGTLDDVDPDPTNPCVPVATASATINPADGSYTYCTDELIAFTSTLPAGYDSLLWTGPNGFTSTLVNPTFPIASPITAGTYSLVVYDHNCASAADTSIVIFDNDCDDDGTPEPTDPDPTNPCIPVATTTPVATNTGAYCTGETIQLMTSTTGVDLYEWTGPTANILDSIQNPTAGSASNTTAGVYSLIVTDHNCMSDTAFTTVVVFPANTVEAGVNQTACVGDSVTVNATGGTSYSWDNGVSNGVPFTVVAGTTTYTVTGNDANGCSATDSLTITSSPTPTVTAISSITNDSICFGYSLTLTATGAQTYTWDNGVINGEPFTFTGTTTFIVTGSNGSGCDDSDSLTVTVIPIPNGEEANADANSDTVCLVTTVVLTGSEGTNPSWMGPNGETFQGEIVTLDDLEANEVGVYIYSTLASNGCYSYDTVELVLAAEGCLDIPDLITLNGDGVNDTWTIGGLELYPEAEVVIYSRWGSVVFEQAPYQNSWAGKSNVSALIGDDSKLLPAGTYFYTLNLNDGTEPREGFIDLK